VFARKDISYAEERKGIPWECIVHPNIIPPQTYVTPRNDSFCSGALAALSLPSPSGMPFPACYVVASERGDHRERTFLHDMGRNGDMEEERDREGEREREREKREERRGEKRRQEETGDGRGVGMGA
jgi:hypothetical protein